MHQHLRAWRKKRGLSQEQVANTLSVRHTTIGRWERGQMKLATADLVRLATLYEASPSQLMVDPSNAELVRTLDRIQGILEHMKPEAVEAWLTLGEQLSKRLNDNSA